MTSERARPECDVRSRNALAAGTEQGSSNSNIFLQNIVWQTLFGMLSWNILLLTVLVFVSNTA